MKKMAKKYWLFKTDPEDFSVEDLKRSPGQTTNWSGVRNYQARNFLRDEIKTGDEVLFYHSNDDPPSIRGICKVVKEAYADESQFNPDDKHFYPSSNPENPVWFQVDIKLQKELKKPVSLPDLKKSSSLKSMVLLKRGNRLSVMPVTEKEFKEVMRIAGEKSDVM
jgi:predicted RNA-binding protein with PUA-like domain